MQPRTPGQPAELGRRAHHHHHHHHSPGLDLPEQNVRNRHLRRPFRLPSAYSRDNLAHRPSPSPDPAPDPFSTTTTYGPRPVATRVERDLRLCALGIEEPEWEVETRPRTTTTDGGGKRKGGVVGWGKRRSLEELGAGHRPLRMRLGVGVTAWGDPMLPGEDGDRGGEAAAAGRSRDARGWFEMLYRDVWFRARQFSGGYFGYGDLDGGDGVYGSPWVALGAEQGGREFVRYAGMVSRPDRNQGGWDRVLGQRAQREAVVMGVIGRVLADAVWDRLLFGAGQGVEAWLETQDEMVIRGEGYERTALRAANIGAILASSDDANLPENFWPAVDEVTARLLHMLLPLLDIMDSHFPGSRSTPLVKINQDLHSLVAEAGYLSLAIRRSPRSIFRFGWPEPGDRWDLDQEQEPECEVVYTKSKAAAEAALEGDKEAKAQVNRRRPTPTAKVKIVLWPKLEMLTKSQTGDKGTYVELIMKSQVAYYCGYLGGQAEEDEGLPSLEDYVDEATKKWRSFSRRLLPQFRAWAWRWFSLIAILLILTIIGLALVEQDDEEGPLRSGQAWAKSLPGKLRIALGWVLNRVWGKPPGMDDDLPWIEDGTEPERPSSRATAAGYM